MFSPHTKQRSTFPLFLHSQFSTVTVVTDITIEESNGMGLKIEMEQGDDITVKHSFFIGNKMQLQYE